MKTQQTLVSSPFLRPILQRLQDGLDHPALHPPVLASGSQTHIPQDHLKLAVAYNGSPRSHAALDLALWIAHQTRVATSQMVTVHVVFVGDSGLKSHALALSEADEILYQARSLAEEWRGHFCTHLCFGDPTSELKNVAAQEGIHLLMIGCESAHHPLVQDLADCPCAVLGIPKVIALPSEIALAR